MKTKTALTIAGSDPSGGAGIQADLKTFVTTGVYGAAVLTGLTAQNTREVSDTMAVPVDFVEKQLTSVLTDIRIDVIKLGMITSSDICHLLSNHIKDYRVVCDPVMVSTSGYRLIDDETVSTLEALIIPVSDYITPNFYELEILHGNKVTDIKAAGTDLMNRYDNLKGIVLKGGHVASCTDTDADMDADMVLDMLLYRDSTGIREKSISSSRYKTKNTHGTGCTFASAFASYLAQNNDAPTAFFNAVTYTHHLISISMDARVGQGHGPLMHHGADSVQP